MEYKIIKFDFKNRKLFAEAAEIRTKVYCEEQKINFDEEFEGLDLDAKHYLLYADGKPVATSRQRITEKGVKLERYAVLKEYRMHGIGKQILFETLVDAKKHNQPIYLHAQESAVGFYEKYGFETKGKPFVEAGIVHYTMYYTPLANVL